MERPENLPLTVDTEVNPLRALYNAIKRRRAENRERSQLHRELFALFGRLFDENQAVGYKYGKFGSERKVITLSQPDGGLVSLEQNYQFEPQYRRYYLHRQNGESLKDVRSEATLAQTIASGQLSSGTVKRTLKSPDLLDWRTNRETGGSKKLTSEATRGLINELEAIRQSLSPSIPPFDSETAIIQE